MNIHDTETNIAYALDRAIEAAGLTAIEQQKGEARQGLRFEIVVVDMGEGEELEIHPHLQGQYYSRHHLAVTISLRSPADQFDQHASARARLRSLISRPGGLSWLCDYVAPYQLLDIRQGETLTAHDYDEEGQNELASEMAYTLRLRIPPAALPAPSV